MKVLLATWSWEPVGGDWTYIQNVKTLYERNGYEVIPFSTYQADKEKPVEGKYFVKAYDYKKLNQNKGIISGLKAAKNSIISLEAMTKIDQLIEEHEISFAHIHTIHHWLTPAIIWKLKNKNIPVIWSLHDYKLICPEATMFSNNKICEKCYGGNFYQCAINKCKKKSFLASALASLDAYFYNWNGIYKKVDAFLCPSEFLLNKFKTFRFNNPNIYLTNLCYDISLIDAFIQKYQGESLARKKDKYILYVGRMEKNKGIHTLIDAVEGTGIKLKIAGTGSAMEELKARVAEKKLTNIQFLGFQQKEDVFELTINSLFVVCPSEWYENYPYSVIETLLFSRPVVGSNIGGIPELVIDGKTGFLHEPGNAMDLREKILLLWNDHKLVEQMGYNARQWAYSKVNFERHWSILENIINKVGVRFKKSLSNELSLK